MKVKKQIMIKALLLATILLFTLGCEETTISTQVLSDGSCIRTMVVESDSGKLGKNGFPIPINDSWTFEYEVEQEKEKKHIYRATKTFASVEDMNTEFLENSGKPPKFKRKVDFTKSFRWFFSRFHYREVTQTVNPFRSIPLDTFFNEQEREILDQWFDDEDGLEKKYPKEELDKLEKKFEEWYLRNLYEEIHLILLQGVKKLDNPELTVQMLMDKKETLFKEFSKNTKALEDLELERVFAMLEENLGADVIQEIRTMEKKAFEEIDAKSKALDNILELGFVNRVTMPGIIVETNAGAIEGNRATWEVEILRVLFTDYDMWVESRQVNWWMVWLTAGLVFLLIILLITTTLRRRRHSH